MTLTPIPRPTRTVLAAALAGLALGACTARDPAHTAAIGPRYASLDATLDGRPGPGASQLPSTAPARAATPVAVLPAWIGRPRHLRERDEADAFEQAVSLDLAPRGEPRENLVLLRMPRTDEAAAGAAGAGPALGGRPSEAGIRAELDAIFPDTAMQVVTRPARNAYGPYGLAIGRTPRGARCLYAWQWIADAPRLDPAAGGAPLSLRVRVCRDDITLEAMAAAMNQLKLVPRFEGVPVASARPSGLAAASGRRRAMHEAAARPRRAVRHAAHEAAPDEAPAVAAEPRMVPERMPVPAPRAERSASPAAASLPAGRRYLGVAETPASLADPAPGPAAMRGTSLGAAPSAPATVSADLPPEALRGPSARVAGRP